MVNKLKSIAEKSFQLNQNNYNLLLALGILSYQQQLWDRSQTYLEDSIKLKPSLDAYLFLGLIAEKTNNKQLLLKSNQNLVTSIRNLN